MLGMFALDAPLVRLSIIKATTTLKVVKFNLFHAGRSNKTLTKFTAEMFRINRNNTLKVAVT